MKYILLFLSIFFIITSGVAYAQKIETEDPTVVDDLGTVPAPPSPALVVDEESSLGLNETQNDVDGLPIVQTEEKTVPSLEERVNVLMYVTAGNSILLLVLMVVLFGKTRRSDRLA